ncbi:Na+-transporting NADH:ubiquinone oxidoreductase subunit NqrA [Roseateles asaccharophilus]|uniref:hypothetical protein n=1 Tax=Roseateles asaccharophilus TaxID=582607 RepID=UPI0038326012
MSQAKRKHGLAGGNRQRQVSVDLQRFNPLSPTARATVNDLVQRGARVIAVRPTLVTLKRGVQTARIDDMGRVTWAS